MQRVKHVVGSMTEGDRITQGPYFVYDDQGLLVPTEAWWALTEEDQREVARRELTRNTHDRRLVKVVTVKEDVDD